MKKINEFIETYENREGKIFEQKIFDLLDLDSTKPENICPANAIENAKKYMELKNILNKLPQKVIKSNIYLDKAQLFINTSPADCAEIMIEMLDNDSTVISLTSKRFPNEYFLPSMDNGTTDQNILYNKVSTKVDNMFCGIYKMQLLNMSLIAPTEHMDIYDCLLQKNKNKLYVSYKLNQIKYEKAKQKKKEN